MTKELITREQGLSQIKNAKWLADGTNTLNFIVNDKNGQQVHAWLTLRPPYCDRGHIQLNIDGDLNLDNADSFPRFFFSFEEADHHVRCFLKWRLWKERVYPHTLEPTPIVLFRPQRGDFEEAMAEVQEVRSLKDVEAILKKNALFPVGKLTCQYYCDDQRHPDWLSTYIICDNGQGIGYTNGPIE